MTIAKMAAPAAKSLLRQATALKPKRKKASDGLLPSLAHQKQNPSSDHNTGFAVDLTHDPVFGFDGFELYEKFKADKRVKYIIFSGKIWSHDNGNRPYTGINQHKKHIHVSIKETAGNDTSNWFPWLPEPRIVDKVKAKVKPLPKKKVVK